MSKGGYTKRREISNEPGGPNWNMAKGLEIIYYNLLIEINRNSMIINSGKVTIETIMDYYSSLNQLFINFQHWVEVSKATGNKAQRRTKRGDITKLITACENNIDKFNKWINSGYAFGKSTSFGGKRKYAIHTNNLMYQIKKDLTEINRELATFQQLIGLGMPITKGGPQNAIVLSKGFEVKEDDEEE